MTLTIDPVNDAPTAADDGSHAIDEDGVLTVAAADGVLDNDGDIDGDALTASLVGGPSHGTLEFDADGGFRYTPDADFHGQDSFTYVANDGALDSGVAKVTITVRPVNDAPGADDDAYAVNEGDTLTVAPADGVLGNDDDIDVPLGLLRRESFDALHTAR